MELEKIITIAIACATFLGLYKVTLDKLWPDKKKKQEDDQEITAAEAVKKCNELSVRMDQIELLRSERYRLIEKKMEEQESKMGKYEERQRRIVRYIKENREWIKKLMLRFYDKTV